MIAMYNEMRGSKWLLFSFHALLFISLFSIAYAYPAFAPEKADASSYGDLVAKSGGVGGITLMSYGAYANKTFIVFRDDDVAPFWSFNTIFNITELFRSKNTPHVMALIPDPYGRTIGSDPALAGYLKSIKGDPLIEFGLHGNEHSTDEFGSLSYAEASFRIGEGLDMVEDVIGTRPVTFVPPFHAYNDNTIRALSKNNMSIISSGPDDVSRGVAFSKAGNISHIPATADFYNWSAERDSTLGEIKAECEASLETYGGCVILFHHWQFADYNGKIIASKVKMLSDVIDWTKDKESSGESVILTFRDAVFGKPLPLLSISILSPSETVYNGSSVDLDARASEILVNMSYRIDGGDGSLLCAYCDRGNSSINLSRLSQENHSLSVFGFDNLSRMVEASVVFGVDSCVPQWLCGGYGNCQKSDARYCNVSLDARGCYDKTKDPTDIFSGDVKALGSVGCDYCTPKWKEVNMTCQANDLFLGRYADSNNCYAQTNLSSDNVRPPDNSYPCDFCTPSWVCSAYGQCTLNGTRACILFDDTNGCYAKTRLPSDDNGRPVNDTISCSPSPPVVRIIEPRAGVDYRSQHVMLNVSTDEISNCSYVLNGAGKSLLFSRARGGAKLIDGELGANLLNISCKSDSGYTNDSVSLWFNVSMAYYAGSINLYSNNSAIVNASFVDTVLVISANKTVQNAGVNITASLFNPTNVSFGAREIGKYIRIEADDIVRSSMKSALLMLLYDESMLGDGIDESSLALYWFNETSMTWLMLNDGMEWVSGTGVNATADYVWTNVSHFSIYGIGGKKADGTLCTRNDECESASCVHGTCRAGSMYCGDSFCDAGESCSSCSADCGGCQSSSSSSSSGGSGRRAAPPKPVTLTVNKSSDTPPSNKSSIRDTAGNTLGSADGGASGRKPASIAGDLNGSMTKNSKQARIVRNTTVLNDSTVSSDTGPTGAYLGAYSYPIYGIAIVVVVLVLYLFLRMRKGGRKGEKDERKDGKGARRDFRGR